MDRRDFLNMVTTVGVAASVAATTAKMTAPAATDVREAKDAAERVLDTRRISCSYAPADPFLIKNPNTGNLSGIFYDLTNRIGELADLDVSWDIEATYGTFGEDLRQHKCDVYAACIWPDANRAKVANFSIPAFYSGMNLYVRADDYRFDGHIERVNSPTVRIATIDGEMSTFVQQSDFPQASVLSTPDGTDISVSCENVASGKADIAIIDKNYAILYMQKNPGKLRNLTDTRPIRIFENTWAVAHESPRFKVLLDAAIKTMLYSGYVDKVLTKYETVSGGFYRIHPPIAH